MSVFPSTTPSNPPITIVLKPNPPRWLCRKERGHDAGSKASSTGPVPFPGIWWEFAEGFIPCCAVGMANGWLLCIRVLDPPSHFYILIYIKYSAFLRWAGLMLLHWDGFELKSWGICHFETMKIIPGFFHNHKMFKWEIGKVFVRFWLRFDWVLIGFNILQNWSVCMDWDCGSCAGLTDWLKLRSSLPEPARALILGNLKALTSWISSSVTFFNQNNFNYLTFPYGWTPMPAKQGSRFSC